MENPNVAQTVERHVEAVGLRGFDSSRSDHTRKCKCGVVIGNRTLIDGRVVNTQRRKFCFACSPFGSGNGQKIGRPSRGRRRLSKAEQRDYQRKMRRERKARLVAMFGGKCSVCDYSKCIRALEFHHKDKSGKTFNLSVLGYTCSWKRLVDEAAKCVLVCANCHREAEDALSV